MVVIRWLLQWWRWSSGGRVVRWCKEERLVAMADGGLNGFSICGGVAGEVSVVSGG